MLISPNGSITFVPHIVLIKWLRSKFSQEISRSFLFPKCIADFRIFRSKLSSFLTGGDQADWVVACERETRGFEPCHSQSTSLFGSPRWPRSPS